MTCKRCQIVPAAHSFNYFGDLNDIKLYYTSPARAHDYKETSETYSYYKAHIDAAKSNKWIWVIDCEGMQMKHYSSIELIKKIMKAILEEHKGLLDKIWIIHPNAWIRGAVTIMKPFLKKDVVERIKIFEGSKLELLVNLEKTGISGQPLKWLLNVFTLPTEPMVLPNPN
jgi:hypothetical protein